MADDKVDKELLQKVLAENKNLLEQVKLLSKTERRLCDIRNALDAQLKQVKSLNEFSLEANSDFEVLPILKSSLKLMHSFFNFDASVILVERNGKLVPVILCADDEDINNLTIIHPPLETSDISSPSDLTNCSILTSEALAVEIPEYLQRAEALVHQVSGKFLFQRLKPATLFVVPLRTTGKSPLGVLIAGISNLKPLSYNQLPPGENDLPLFELAASHIELALGNAYLNQSKSLFLANMSHELRTPMHGILSYANFGQKKIETASKEKLKSYFDEIHDSGNRLMGLLNNLLDLAKLESGKIVYTKKEVDLGAAIRSVVGESGAFAEQAGIKLEFNGDHLPIVGNYDEEKLQQVIRNLLINAIKFSFKGTTVRIVLQQTEKTNVFEIINHGIEIPQTELKTIFDKFVQGSKTKTGAGGTGLGLAICKEIVQQQGGKIRAECEAGKETKFIVELPRAASVPDANRAA